MRMRGEYDIAAKLLDLAMHLMSVGPKLRELEKQLDDDPKNADAFKNVCRETLNIGFIIGASIGLGWVTNDTEILNDLKEKSALYPELKAATELVLK